MPNRRSIGDRFIPLRSASNLYLFDIPTPTSYYQALIGSALFGPNFSTRQNMFRYTLLDQHKPPILPPPRVRKICTTPFRSLDAPYLSDDCYLSLLDWSSRDLLAVGLRNYVYLWTRNNGNVTELEIDNTVCSVAWAPDGTSLAVGTDSGKLHLWDVGECRWTRTMDGHCLRLGALSWSPLLLSSGSRDKTILQRDVRCREDSVSKLTGHKSEVCGLKWSYDNRDLASGGKDNRLFIWNQNLNSKPVLKYCEHTSAVKAISWSPHDHGLISSGSNRYLRFLDTKTNTHLSCVDTGSQVCNLLWSKNLNELVSTHGKSKNEIIVWSYHPQMIKLATLTGHSDRVLHLAVSPDGEDIVSGAGAGDETLHFWKVFPFQSRKTDRDLRASSFGTTQSCSSSFDRFNIIR